MTEEEKKAIDLLKFYEGFFKNIGHEEEVKSIENIINLIEKLQKENEELRKNQKYKKDFNGEKIFCLEYDKETLRDMVVEKQEEIKELKSNSIPKDKIREKLERLENQKENYKEQPLIYMLLKNQYKELLEEE